MAAGVSGTIWGSFSGTSTANVRPYIAYSETYDASTNTSSVTATLWFVKYNASWGSYNGSFSNTAYLNGTSYTTNSAFDLRPVGTAPVYDEVKTRTVSVTHDADGTKTCTIGWSGSTGTSLGTFDFSSSIALTAITRATVVTTSDASSVGGTSATVGGDVTDAGLPPCSSRGVYWGTSSGSLPNQIVSGSGGGAFNVNITGLARGTTYYYKAFSYNSSGEKYGAIKSFTTTAAAPSVSTGSSSSVTYNSATVSGSVSDDNGATVTTRGICYNTTGSPTVDSSKVASGSGEGDFSSNLTGLNPDTTYYARAYATNSQGASYGGQISFVTLSAEPTVTTTSGATGITTSTATVAGNVTSDNGSTITERGFCYSTSTNPTTANAKAIVSGTTGAMSKEITGLAIGTKYYFKAYATNARGTGYGSQSSFTTLPGNPSGLNATRIDKSSMSLSWVKGNGGTYSIVRRGTIAPANINSGTLVYQGTGTSLTDTGLSAGTTYYYRVWSATTADWSEAYSAGYSADYDTTVYNFENTSNALVDDTNYATVPTNDGVLKCQLSRDGGETWSATRELTFTSSIATQDFGEGQTELWGMMTWSGTHVNDTNFRVKIIGGSSDKSYQIFKNFGFSINPSFILTGIRVQAKAAYDNVDLLVYFIKVDVYYGSSPLPVSQGSLAYDSTLDRPTYYNGGDWVPMGGGSKVTVAETAPSDPKFGDIWIDISSD